MAGADCVIQLILADKSQVIRSSRRVDRDVRTKTDSSEVTMDDPRWQPNHLNQTGSSLTG